MENEIGDREPSWAASSSEAGRVETIAGLAARLGIDTLLVSIPRVARALGYAPSTLYGYIAAGRFFLPVRTVNGSPMVATDDLVDWVSSRSGERAPAKVEGGRRRRAASADGLASTKDAGGAEWRAEVERRAFAKSVAVRVAAARDAARLGGVKRRGRPPKPKGPSDGSAPSRGAEP